MTLLLRHLFAFVIFFSLDNLSLQSSDLENYIDDETRYYDSGKSLSDLGRENEDLTVFWIFLSLFVVLVLFFSTFSLQNMKYPTLMHWLASWVNSTSKTIFHSSSTASQVPPIQFSSS